MSILPQKIGARSSSIYPETIKQASVYTTTSQERSYVNKIMIGVAIVVGCIAVIYGTIYTNFIMQFEDEWSRVETVDGYYYDLILDIHGGKIDYIFDSMMVEDVIASYEYTVVAPGKVLINNRTIEVEIKDDMMIFTPALTSSDSKEYWFK